MPSWATPIASKICWLNKKPNCSLDISSENPCFKWFSNIFEAALYARFYKEMGRNSLKELGDENLGIKAKKVEFKIP